MDLYGPDPLPDFLEGVLRNSSTRIGYPLRTHPVRQAAASGRLLLDDGDITVRCTPLTHRVPAYAYRVDQKPRAGPVKVRCLSAYNHSVRISSMLRVPGTISASLLITPSTIASGQDAPLVIRMVMDAFSLGR